MNDDLNRVESAVTATASGNLTWEQWPHDCATALGFAGQRNPLGFAVVRYLGDEPSGSAALSVILHLATVLIKRGYDPKKANDAAWAAVDAWNHIKCPALLRAWCANYRAAAVRGLQWHRRARQGRPA